MFVVRTNTLVETMNRRSQFLSGTARFLPYLICATITTIPAPSLLAQTAVYENFQSGVRTSNDGTPLYLAYMNANANACPSQLGGIENGVWREQTLDCQGYNDLYWYLDRIGANWTDHNSGFFRDYMLPGQTWNPSFNRLSFQWRCDYSFPFYPGANVQYGTFIKDPTDNDPTHNESNNWHFYHFLSANQQPFRWIYATVSDKPQHQRSVPNSSTLPENPTYEPHYYDYMITSYSDFLPNATKNYGTCHFDNFVFSFATDEPTYYTSSLTYQYTGSHYEVSWQTPFSSKLQYEVRYSQQSMKAKGFSSGVNGGTVTSRGDAYVGVLWASSIRWS